MSKTRRVSFDTPTPVEMDHLDGGTIGIIEMEYDAAEAYSAACTKTEIERDTNGQVIFNRGGDPVRRFVTDTMAEILIASGRVAYVKNLEDEEGAPVTLPGGNGVSEDRVDKRLIGFLKLVGTSEIPVDSKGREFIGTSDQVRASAIPLVGEDDKKKPLENAKVGADGLVVITVQEPIWKWVIRESSRIRREHNESIRKNS